MKKILKEPLLHFLGIGACLYLLFIWFGDSGTKIDTIVIDDGDIHRLVSNWETQWNATPTEKELQGLLDQYIRSEIFYREALKMNLDHNDEIVKRRLAQKMEFLMNDMTALSEPDEEELRIYFKRNEPKYRLSPVISFYSVYFNPNKRADAKGRAGQLLPTLSSNPDAEYIQQFGDPSLLQTEFIKMDQIRLSRILGSRFADSVFMLYTGKWQGPLSSAYGQHLIYPFDKKEGSQPDLETIKNRVGQDYRFELQQQYNESIYLGFKEKYEVIIEISDSLITRNN